MPSNLNEHQVLRDFESAMHYKTTSAYEFIKANKLSCGAQLQEELIAIEIEIKLLLQIRVPTEQLKEQFPHLLNRIDRIYADTVLDFVREHCPIREIAGTLPNELDGYRIIEEIGRGGMGVVYRANQLSLDREVALKVLFFSPEKIADEARNLASLEHPNICRVYDVGKLKGLPFMSMQLITGQRLTDWIKEKAPVKLESCIRLVAQVALAMQEAHDLDIAHLDIKPSNILLQKTDRPVLTDFGLAGQSTESQPALLGTPSFLPPEQIRKEGPINPKLCDIYSLGAVFFETLTGRRAFHGTVEHVIDQVLNDPPRRPCDYRADIDHTLETLCLKAMDKNPGKRFQSMVEFHDSLISYLNRKQH